MYGVARLVDLLRSQWWSCERIHRWQLRQLQLLVEHAYHNVPLHRRRMDAAGVHPDEVRSLADLQRIPILTRSEIQEAPFEDVLASGAELRRCIRSSTSGSTGRPLEIVSSRRDRAVFNPSFIRVYLNWGLRPWHRLAYLQARPERLGHRSWFERLGLLRKRILSSRDEPSVWVEELRAWRPHLLHGYSLTLKLLAEEVLESGRDDLRVPLVASTSGILDRAGREMLERALGARVVDIYASEEAGAVIAWQCPSCGAYHVDSDTTILEVLRDGRPAAAGEEGDVVVTNLHNLTMPFIRYQQGDTVRLSTASPACGRHTPLLEEVSGRAGDYIVLPSGRVLTPHPFFLVLDHALGVGEWQVVQETASRIRVFVTVRRGDASGATAEVRARIAELLEPGIDVVVEVVDSVRRSREHKLRSVISQLSRPQLGHRR